MRPSSALLLVLLPLPALASVPVLRDVTAQSGVVHSYSDSVMPWGGGGLAVGDFDGDGVQDLIVAGGEGAPLRAWRGGGDLTFTEVDLGLPDYGAEKAIAAADFDNDGDLDLFVSVVEGTSRLLRADGPFQFVNVTKGAGIQQAAGSWDMDVQWGDVNGDGWLDLFVGRYDSWNNSGSLLYLSDGDGTFTLAPQAGGASGADFVNTKNAEKVVSGANLGTRLFDMDMDGDLDLFVANDRGYGGNEWFCAFLNDGGGHFSDVTLDVMDPVQANGMGIAIADLDRDGTFDLYVTNTLSGHFLFSNHCSHLTDVAASKKAALNQSGWGVVAADLDQDGWEDLYVTHDVNAPPGWNALLHNQQDGTFVDVAWQSDASLGSTDSATVAAGDLDGDGDPDLVVLNQDSPVRVLRNDTDGGHWLRVRLVGTTSNRDGLGALVELFVGSQRQLRQPASTAGYLATSQLGAHFGLGGAALVDRVVVRWPTGTTQVIEGVAADQVLTIIEQQTGGAAALGAELCGNGADDDCDGVTDEGYEALGEPCIAASTDDGCVVPGAIACTASADGLQCLPAGAPVSAPAAVELCGDGQDNDCDGQVDEGFEAVGEGCEVAVAGACPTPGVIACTANALAVECVAGPPPPAPLELCGNALDDDCDGAVDEGFEAVGAWCALRFGGLGTRIDGVLECTEDRLGVACRPAADAPVGAPPETGTPADAGATRADTAGAPSIDASTDHDSETAPDVAPGQVTPARSSPSGGCAAAGGGASWLAGLLLLAWRRRR